MREIENFCTSIFSSLPINLYIQLNKIIEQTNNEEIRKTALEISEHITKIQELTGNLSLLNENEISTNMMDDYYKKMSEKYDDLNHYYNNFSSNNGYM